MSTTVQVPSADDNDELLLSCRYGDIEEIQQFVEQFGSESLSTVRDDNGNCVLHMVCGNGHTDVLDYLLPLVSPSLLSCQNTAKSTPLHWAALNSHLAVAQKLVEFPGGPGIDLIDVKNTAGRSPLGEAEMAGWEEGAKWMVEVMKLEADDAIKEEEGDPVEGEDGEGGAVSDIEVEIEDADGKLAKMTIRGSGGVTEVS